MQLFKKGFYLTFFPKKFNKSIVGVRGVITANNNYLLVKRASTDRNNADKWEFPGGSIEVNEDLLNSLRREIKEEVGLKVQKIDTCCFITYHDVPKSSKSVYKGFRRYVFFYKCAVFSNKEVILSDEHSAYKWVTLKSAFKLQLTEDSVSFLNSLRDKA